MAKSDILNQDMNVKSRAKVPEIVGAISHSDRKALYILCKLDKAFEVTSTDDFNAFIQENPELIGNLLPVDDEKNVIVPKGVRTTECRLTSRGFNSLLMGLGTSLSLEGIGDGSKAIKPWAIALQHRHVTIAIDIDADVFGMLPASTVLDGKLITWLKTHEAGAIKVRGNRKRLVLFFKLAPELAAHLSALAARNNKVAYKIPGGAGAKIELQYGTANNTLYGTHPDAGRYQQIYPKANKLGELTLEAYQELIEILEAVSIRSAGDGEYEATEGRVELPDVPELVQPLRAALDIRKKILESAKLDSAIELKIEPFLNAKVQEILRGKLVYVGNSYDDVTGPTPITEGNRRSTYLHVGSDVNHVIELFETVGIQFSDEEINDLLGKLWDLTDTGGSGGKASEFDEEEAIETFAAYPYVCYKPAYLVALVKRVSRTVIEDK